MENRELKDGEMEILEKTEKESNCEDSLLSDDAELKIDLSMADSSESSVAKDNLNCDIPDIYHKIPKRNSESIVEGSVVCENKLINQLSIDSSVEESEELPKNNFEESSKSKQKVDDNSTVLEDSFEASCNAAFDKKYDHDSSGKCDKIASQKKEITEDYHVTEPEENEEALSSQEEEKDSSFNPEEEEKDSSFNPEDSFEMKENLEEGELEEGELEDEEEETKEAAGGEEVPMETEEAQGEIPVQTEENDAKEEDGKRKHDEDKSKRKKRKHHHYNSEEEQEAARKKKEKIADFDSLLKRQMFLMGSGSEEGFQEEQNFEVQVPPMQLKTEECESLDSGTGDEWDGKQNRRRSKRKRRGSRSPSRKNEAICMFYLQGSCRRAGDCPYSHEVSPTRKMELCKFYMMDCCAKKEKCLYMHKDFPCKYYHFGFKCKDGELCRFSHNPLQEITKSILLKHIELAPKDILGDFPRVSKHSAQTVLSVTLAKRKGEPIPTDNLDAVEDYEGKGFRYLDRALKSWRKGKNKEKGAEKEKTAEAEKNEEKEKKEDKEGEKKEVASKEVEKEKKDEKSETKKERKERVRERSSKKSRSHDKDEHRDRERSSRGDSDRRHRDKGRDRDRHRSGTGRNSSRWDPGPPLSDGKSSVRHEERGGGYSNDIRQGGKRWHPMSDEEGELNMSNDRRNLRPFSPGRRGIEEKPLLPEDAGNLNLANIDFSIIKNVLNTVQSKSSQNAHHSLPDDSLWDDSPSDPYSNQRNFVDDIKDVFYDPPEQQQQREPSSDMSRNISSLIQSVREATAPHSSQYSQKEPLLALPPRRKDSWEDIPPMRHHSLDLHPSPSDASLRRSVSTGGVAPYDDPNYGFKREEEPQDFPKAVARNRVVEDDDDDEKPADSIYNFGVQEELTEEEEEYANGLPFRVPMHISAKEIDASLNTHKPIYYTLVEVTIPKNTFPRHKFNKDDPKMAEDPRIKKMFSRISTETSKYERQKSPSTESQSEPRVSVNRDPRSSRFETDSRPDPRKDPRGGPPRIDPRVTMEARSNPRNEMRFDPRSMNDIDSRNDPRMLPVARGDPRAGDPRGNQRMDPRAINSCIDPRMDPRDCIESRMDPRDCIDPRMDPRDCIDPRMDPRDCIDPRMDPHDSMMLDDPGGYSNGMMDGPGYPYMSGGPPMSHGRDPRGRPGLLGPRPNGMRMGPQSGNFGAFSQRDDIMEQDYGPNQGWGSARGSFDPRRKGLGMGS